MSLLDTFRMNCQQASSLHQKKKEGKLGIAERLGLWIHLLYCSFCKLFFEQATLLDKAVKHTHAAEKAMAPEAKQRVQKALSDELKS